MKQSFGTGILKKWVKIQHGIENFLKLTNRDAKHERLSQTNKQPPQNYHEQRLGK